jgi:hypothetical protein
MTRYRTSQKFLRNKITVSGKGAVPPCGFSCRMR